MEEIKELIGQKILVIEDEKINREFLKKVLRHTGFNVLLAEDAEQACEIFERENENIALMLSDVVLPGTTGVELADKFLSEKPDLRVLLCSGYTDDECKWMDIQSKGYHFLGKPFSIYTLMHKLKEVMKD